ncbi:MAG: hypothetical protein GYA41_02235 [Bacteroidales bacterium]|nr:hypothetical protein [Bacteroidales bacterium]
MESINVAKRENFINFYSVTNGGRYDFQLPGILSLKSTVLEHLLLNGCEDLHNYVCWTGLAREKGIMVLLPISHYHYDFEDLKGVRILISQKKLNNVKHLESYLHTLFKAMPGDGYFFGCFECNDKPASGKTSVTASKFRCSMKYPEAQPERLFTRKGVSIILEGHGYKLIDLTDINGITYFCARIKKSGG